MNPMIFLHGAMSDARVWEPLADKLAGGRDVHVLDFAGHGTRQGECGPFTLARFAQDTAGFARCLPARPIIVGWSLGASVAMMVAAMKDVSAGAILVGATPQLVSDDQFAFGQPPAAAAAREKGLAMSYAATARHFARAIAGGHSDAEKTVAACAMAADPQVAIEVFRCAGRESLVPLLADIRVPLRLIHGGRDEIVVPRAAQYIAEHAPHAAPAALIPQAGHAPFLTHPDGFLAAFASALAAIEHGAACEVTTGNREMDG